jgi:prepilin-type processing-associated H-X9-DG protein
MNNLRQIGIALVSYSGDNNGYLPTPPSSQLPLDFGVTSPLYWDDSGENCTFIWNCVSSYLGGNGRVFYCPSLRFRGNSSWPFDIDFTTYPVRFTLLSGPGTWGGLPVIDYTGNPYYRLDETPDVRGSYCFGSFETIGGVQVPKRILLFDATFGFYGGILRNHTAVREVGKNALFVDGSVRWLQPKDWHRND